MANVTESDSTPSSIIPSLPPAHTNALPPSLWVLLRIWFMLGLQSFGGGTATLFLIRRAVVEQQHWISAEEFTQAWSLCLITPGINLLSMTILVGRRIAGVPGALVALVGLMLPSVTITILMTALYAELQRLTVVQAALRGIVPATVGLGLLLASSMARPLLATSRNEGRFSLAIAVLILVGSAIATALLHLPVIVVLCGAGTIGALTMWWQATHAERHHD